MNFLIAYLKEIEPILQHLEFNKEKNTAYIVFLNRFHSVKRVYLRFDRKYVEVYCRYVFKDEELAIILEKSMLDKTVVVLREMDITDSFVLYLANSEKMSSIVCLDISYCSKITESAVNSLLVSPFCNNI